MTAIFSAKPPRFVGATTGGTYRVAAFQVLLGNKFLYLVDGDGLIHGAAGAGVLTAAVAHAAAYGGGRDSLFL